MDGIAAGGRPIDVGRLKSRSPRNVSGRPRLKIRRWPLHVRRQPRPNMVMVMLAVTRRPFLSDRVVCKADRHSDRSDKALDHGSALPWRIELLRT
jgi:hypothetical protein